MPDWLTGSKFGMQWWQDNVHRLTDDRLLKLSQRPHREDIRVWAREQFDLRRRKSPKARPATHPLPQPSSAALEAMFDEWDDEL